MKQLKGNYSPQELVETKIELQMMMLMLPHIYWTCKTEMDQISIKGDFISTYFSCMHLSLNYELILIISNVWSTSPFLRTAIHFLVTPSLITVQTPEPESDVLSAHTD